MYTATALTPLRPFGIGHSLRICIGPAALLLCQRRSARTRRPRASDGAPGLSVLSSAPPTAVPRGAHVGAFGIASSGFAYAAAPSLQRIRDALAQDKAARSNVTAGAGPDVSPPPAAGPATTPHPAEPPSQRPPDQAQQVAPQQHQQQPQMLADYARVRAAYLRTRAVDDCGDVLRKHAARYMAALPQLDAEARATRRSLLTSVHARLTVAGGPAARLAAVAAMPDAELAAAVRAGAIEPLAMWEGAAEFSPLPNEFFEARESATALAAELAGTARGDHSDDACAVLAKAKRGNFADISEAELQVLEAHEARATTGYVQQPNAVLAFVARRDAAVAASLAVMDRVRRSTLADVEFQKAVAHTRALSHQRRGQVRVNARVPDGVSDAPLFFKSQFTVPPPKAVGAPSQDPRKPQTLFASPRQRRQKWASNPQFSMPSTKRAGPK